MSRQSIRSEGAEPGELYPAFFALAEISDDKLERLIGATFGVPQIAPGLLAWIDGACDWELNHRRGVDYPLQPPEAAIDPSEDAVSIDAAMAMRLAFLKDDRPEAQVVLPLFDALVELLTGGERRH